VGDVVRGVLAPSVVGTAAAPDCVVDEVALSAVVVSPETAPTAVVVVTVVFAFDGELDPLHAVATTATREATTRARPRGVTRFIRHVLSW